MITSVRVQCVPHLGGRCGVRLPPVGGAVCDLPRSTWVPTAKSVRSRTPMCKGVLWSSWCPGMVFLVDRISPMFLDFETP